MTQLAGIEVSFLCSPCFAGKHANCTRTVSWRPERGPVEYVSCGCPNRHRGWHL